MSAILSPCGTYRLRLERVVDMLSLVTAALLGVNPSTADAIENDATIRKDMGFARIHRWGRIIKGNKFAYRAKDVRELKHVADPIGPGCDDELRRIIADSDVVVACWGPLSKLPRELRNRWRDVVRMADDAGKPLMCFGTAKDGQPRHTLMLPYDTPLVVWRAPTPAPHRTDMEE